MAQNAYITSSMINEAGINSWHEFHAVKNEKFPGLSLSAGARQLIDSRNNRGA